ncbi:MAG: tRNA (N(6)-L-threonylcarbamoyladenosine(37)-C(2))-methylthiotransferase MtaB, partial [Cytophagia bacterium]|nr:tRNA (N(6)-L-threonylcarbamoyladenosine(37)-C(2))-methylthiotransferase MtaB [Cytophagia bacterium]
ENYVRVAAKYDPLLINELKTVQLTQINEKGVVEVEEPEMVFETH